LNLQLSVLHGRHNTRNIAGRAIAVSRSTQDAPCGGSNFNLINYRRGVIIELFRNLWHKAAGEDL